jgi:hypothetical protein
MERGGRPREGLRGMVGWLLCMLNAAATMYMVDDLTRCHALYGLDFGSDLSLRR